MWVFSYSSNWKSVESYIITKSVVYGMIFKNYALERKKAEFCYVTSHHNFLKNPFILFKLFLEFAFVFELKFLNGVIC